jgi:hypothetical protein
MFDDLSNFMSEIWTHQPIIIVVLVGLVLLFPLLVIDTYRHRKKAKKTRDRKKLH